MSFLFLKIIFTFENKALPIQSIIKQTCMKTAKVILAIILVIALGACKKQIEIQEIIKEVEKKKSWQEHPGVLFDSKICKNMTSDEGQVYIYSINGIYWVDSTKVLGSTFSTFHLPDQKPFINKDFFLQFYPRDSTLSIFKTREYNYIERKMKNFDPNFNQFYPFNYNKQLVWANNQNFVLIPYTRNTLPNSGDYFQKLLLFKIGLGDRMAIEDTKILTFPSEGRLIGLMSIDEFFIISIDDFTGSNAGSFKITSDGTIKKVSTQMFTRVVKFKNELLAINEGGSFYKSDLSGENWQKLADTEISSHMNYAVINNELYGFIQDDIYYFDFGVDKLTLKAVKNDGLERNFITGMAALHDKVYVATLSGLFLKPITSLKTFAD
jgi:hypothetical protein